MSKACNQKLRNSNNNVTKLGTSYATIRSLGSVGGMLVAGREDGNLEFIDVTTGTASPFMATGLGSITAIVEGPTNTYFAASNSTW